MTNHDIIKIVNFVLNKDINGNAYSAAEFTSMINAQSLSLFYEKLGLTKEYQLDAPIARTGVGVSKKLMIRAGASIANMHTDNTRFESFSLYTKYRFLSKDELHKHFRMAVYAEASRTNAPFHYDEISMMGDKSGVELGIIATQLWNKFALSGTVSHTQVLDKSRNDKVIYIPERLSLIHISEPTRPY